MLTPFLCSRVALMLWTCAVVCFSSAPCFSAASRVLSSIPCSCLMCVERFSRTSAVSSASRWWPFMSRCRSRSVASACSAASSSLPAAAMCRVVRSSWPSFTCAKLLRWPSMAVSALATLPFRASRPAPSRAARRSTPSRPAEQCWWRSCAFASADFVASCSRSSLPRISASFTSSTLVFCRLLTVSPWLLRSASNSWSTLPSEALFSSTLASVTAMSFITCIICCCSSRTLSATGRKTEIMWCWMKACMDSSPPFSLLRGGRPMSASAGTS
mmetsp:Transcript_96318/g.272342  ORF Transcript_96318/g.272342 Transcript_96318/m.272342 type:complete len:272 (-) Transcript_96318:117-932(-)